MYVYIYILVMYRYIYVFTYTHGIQWSDGIDGKKQTPWSFWQRMSDQHGGLRLHPSFQKLWKFWRCKFVPFQYFFWGYFWVAFFEPRGKERWQIHRPEGRWHQWQCGIPCIGSSWLPDRSPTGRSKLPIFRPWIPNGRLNSGHGSFLK